RRAPTLALYPYTTLFRSPVVAPSDLACGGSRDRHNTQRVLSVSSKKRGSQAGSHGSHTGHVTYPCSRASTTCLKYRRSASGIRVVHVQSVRWKRRELRCAQKGSAGAAVAVAAGASAAANGSAADGVVVAAGGAVSTVGTLESAPTGSTSFRFRFVSTVWRNSSLARRNSRIARPTIR